VIIARYAPGLIGRWSAPQGAQTKEKAD